MTMHYAKAFYEYQKAGSLSSAQTVVPIVLKFVKPNSVVDVGCGVGTWLSTFKSHGVTEILGMDGSYVDRSMLEIDECNFSPTDISKPVDIGRSFDLAMSLEAAEHIAPESADTLVNTLVGLAPIVLFSAAIPHQRGAGHINEQWPDYWRAKFAHHGYVPIDCIRGPIWDDASVRVWYRQNLMFFANRALLGNYPALQQAHESAQQHPLSIVHPEYYLERSSLALEHPARALGYYWWDSVVEWLKRHLPASVISRLRAVRKRLVNASTPGELH